jgi:predicted nucleic acid-binding Zn ribbon protein
MIYEMECELCGYGADVECSLTEHNTLIKPGVVCPCCEGRMMQVLSPPKIVFAREGFPKGDPRWEHASDVPMYIRDRIHLKDVCEANGNISKYLEDDM